MDRFLYETGGAFFRGGDLKLAGGFKGEGVLIFMFPIPTVSNYNYGLGFA